jgi:predicted small secreted protein
MEVHLRGSAFSVRRILCVAALLGSLVVSGCATTSGHGGDGSESDFARSGVYAGLFGIKSYENFDLSGGVHSGDGDLGAGVKLGYRISPEIAVEAIAENIKGFRVSDGKVDDDLDLLNFGVMAKYYFMTDRFQPYVIGGVGVARSDVSGFNYDHDGGFLRGGLGIDVYLSHNFALFSELDYNRMVGGVSDLHHIDFQVGLIYRF